MCIRDRLKPYRSADRAEARADSANLDALQKQAQQQSPELQSNPYSRWQQKRAIKKEYAAAKTGGGTVRASEVTAKAAKRAAEDTKNCILYTSRHRQQRRPSGPEESKRQERTGCIACAASGKCQSKGYADGSGYEARFTQCGICTLMKKLGLYDRTLAMCHPVSYTHLRRFLWQDRQNPKSLRFTQDF